MSSQKIEEPKILYRLSVIPASPQDLEQLKQDLIANETLRLHIYLTINLQSVLDYEQNKRPDIAKLLVKEAPCIE